MSKDDTTVPRMLHKTNDPDPASPANRCVVNTQEELADALKAGWVLSAGDTRQAKADDRADAAEAKAEAKQAKEDAKSERKG